MRRLPRSYLFVPADRPERFIRALASGADAIIIDLEDAVAPLAKDDARETLRNWLNTLVSIPTVQIWVRVNASGTAWHAADMSLFQRAPLAGVVLPKVEKADDLRDLAPALSPGQLVLPLIETARGIASVREIALGPRVQRLLFGSVDLQLDLGIRCSETENELAFHRAELVLASRLAGLPPPVDGVHVALEDLRLLLQMVASAKRMGYMAKMCVHPRQVEAVNQGFSPEQDEINWARRVLDAVQKSAGAAVSVDGKMIDAPVIAVAQRVLDQIEE